MAKSRLDLHDELKEVLGANYVYFQPPETAKLQYPCLIYSLDGIDTRRADNRIYLNCRQYQITYIGRDPDTDIQERMLDHFQYCNYDRRYIADNLYHDTFTLYY